MNFIKIYFLFILIFNSCQIFSQLTDFNGNNYKNFKQKACRYREFEQEWMAENLNVSCFSNGDPIFESKDIEDWTRAANEGIPSFCYNGFNPVNGKKYGKLYNWFAVCDPRGLAPIGWHIATKEDYNNFLMCELVENVYRDEKGIKLISIDEGIKAKPIIKTDFGGYFESNPCSNCSWWTTEQKKNNPCSLCKNTGKTQGKFIPKSKLKVEEKSIIDGWEGTNSIGFNALPGGYIKNDGSLEKLPTYPMGIFYTDACFWTSTARSKGDYDYSRIYGKLPQINIDSTKDCCAYSMLLESSQKDFLNLYPNWSSGWNGGSQPFNGLTGEIIDKGSGCSVRCVKNH